MVLKVVEPHWKRTPITADRVRRRIGEVLGYAEARGLRKAGPLPTRWAGHLDKLLPRPRDVKKLEHHAAMGFDAVPNLYRKLIATDAIPELCLAFTILTATRSGEARGARWDEIDLANKLWVIPAARMKADREHRVPLSDEAMALIQRLPRNGGDLLFTVNGSGKAVNALTVRKALKRHGGDGYTVHGMRSCFRDWGGERSAAPRELLEVALAHAIGSKVEQAYARGDLLEKRRKIMTQWAQHCATPAAGDTAKGGDLGREASSWMTP
jgi:integrase